MGAVRLFVDIERPIYQVFDYVTDLRHDPQWFVGVSDSRLVSDVQHGQGATYEQLNRLFGWHFRSRLRVAEYDPPKHMRLLALNSAIPFAADYHFEPVGGRPGPVTRFTLDAQVRSASAYRLLGPALFPLLRLAVNRRLRLLKQILEKQQR